VQHVASHTLRLEKKRYLQALRSARDPPPSLHALLQSVSDELVELRTPLDALSLRHKSLRHTLDAFFQRNIQLTSRCLSTQKALEVTLQNYHALKASMQARHRLEAEHNPFTQHVQQQQQQAAHAAAAQAQGQAHVNGGGGGRTHRVHSASFGQHQQHDEKEDGLFGLGFHQPSSSASTAAGSPTASAFGSAGARYGSGSGSGAVLSPSPPGTAMGARPSSSHGTGRPGSSHGSAAAGPASIPPSLSAMDWAAMEYEKSGGGAHGALRPSPPPPKRDAKPAQQQSSHAQPQGAPGAGPRRPSGNARSQSVPASLLGAPLQQPSVQGPYLPKV